MAHNYSKHFGNNRQQASSPSHEHTIDVVQQMTNQVEEVNEPVVEETKQERVLVNGIVSGCELLNIRTKGSKDADVLCTIGVNTMVKVDLTVDKEAEEFYKIVTPNGVEGYCMKKFITIK